MSKLVLFCHSLRSDWNHGNAHFLRGLLAEFEARGFAVAAYESADGWSARNLAKDHGRAALDAWREAYPSLPVEAYEPARLDLDRALDGADLVLVHEWNEPDLVARIAAHRKRGGRYLLFFHDTHRRMASAPQAISKFDLDGFDGVVAFGEVLREAYAARGWGRRAFTWHEAADLRLFRPHREIAKTGDLVWIGNWGDEERSAELEEFLVAPVRDLRLRARVHGVRYPDKARRTLAAAGIELAGYLPNFAAPRAFGAANATVHIPRRPYVRDLPGIPTIRVFEALACGIPLVCAPWQDCEGLFTPGEDFLMARDGDEMRRLFAALVADAELREALAQRGRATVEARHGCSHRAAELIAICRALGREFSPPLPVAAQ